MTTSQPSSWALQLRRALLLGGTASRADGQLLGEFIERRDELAFEALLRRHGPMVLGVCRRVLGHEQDAEDAFQATFLVLARKARSVVPRQQVGNWLYGVAYHTALKARSAIARRRQRERQVNPMPEPEAARADLWREVEAVLDEELARLPERYRLPVVLCDLEGKGHREAAGQLGWPQGTLSGRLSRARKLLAERLARRGLTLSASALAGLLAETVATAGVRPGLVRGTVEAASRFAAGQAAAAVTSARVVALTEGVLKAMLLSKLKGTSAVVVLVFALATGGLLTRTTPAADPPAPKPAPQGRVANARAMQFDITARDGRVAIRAVLHGETITAEADRARYDEAKGVLILEGKGRQGVTVRKQSKPAELIRGSEVRLWGRENRVEVRTAFTPAPPETAAARLLYAAILQQARAALELKEKEDPIQASRVFLRRAYLDLLGRPPTADELVAFDLAFLRRAYLDLLGRPPTADEMRAFLADKSPDRTKKWLDRLLADPSRKPKAGTKP